MKKLNTFVLFTLFTLPTFLSAQTDDQMKLDNLKYYLSSIREYTQSMRYYTDSIKIISLLDQMDVITANLGEEIDKIVIPEIQVQEMSTDSFMVNTEPEVEKIEEPSWKSEQMPNVEEENKEGLGVSKFMPFKNKFNTSLKIQFGINSISQGESSPAGIIVPEINTGGSWYWDFALIRRARIGGSNSKVAFNYGISFLKNRFKIENDLRLIINSNNDPQFISISDVKENPKLNVGYLNVPLSLTFSLSKKTKLEIGGYAGYRVLTVQKFHLKTNQETIEEQRYAGYKLNNWVYGATASLDISGFDLIARYNFSGLFKDNPNYDFNTFMIGTSVSLF